MKKSIATFLLLFLVSSAFSQTSCKPCGEWYTEDKDAVVTIYKEGNTISGKTTWLKEPLDKDGNDKLDLKNPEEKLRTRKRMGLKIMHGFKYNQEANSWEEGRIYKPANGKTYGGKATLVNNNTLELEGYLLSLPFIGKSSTWTRKIK